MDGSTDAGNVEEEVLMVQFGVADKQMQVLKSYTRFLSVETPKRTDADGLLECLSAGLKLVGIDNMDKDTALTADATLVGVSTDGAAVNIAELNGLKGKVQRKIPWVVWEWCYAHRLE